MNPLLVRALRKKPIPRANYALGMRTFVLFRKLFSRGLCRLARIEVTGTTNGQCDKHHRRLACFDGGLKPAATKPLLRLVELAGFALG